MLKRLGERLFDCYCHPDFQEDIRGDLEEYYVVNLEKRGKAYADRKYFFDSILLFRMALLRDNWLGEKTKDLSMFRNNMKMAFRQMARQKFYASLNLIGLAIGITACLLIGIYVQDELSYDKDYANSESIYRVTAYSKFGNNESYIDAAPAPMAKALKSDFPEIENAGRTVTGSTELLRINDSFYKQDGIVWADQEFLDIFNFNVLQGDPKHLLDQPNSTVLTQSTSKKFFGEENPLGQIIRFGDKVDLVVTGVLKDLPSNTHLKSEMFITLLNNAGSRRNIWLGNNYTTYVQLDQKQASQDVESKLPEYLLNKIGPQLKQYMDIDMEEGIASGNLDLKYLFQPIERIHLYSDRDFGIESSGSIDKVNMFSLIGLFILLTACFNFINMATARSTVRAKEIGVRKVLGSRRKQLVSQFLLESLVNSVMAMTIAIVLTYTLLPEFNRLTGKAVIDPIFGTNGLWPYLVLCSVMIGIVAGLYPSFVMARFSVVKSLKGQLRLGRGKAWLRQTLVVVQFTTSIALIIASLIVYQQLNFLQNKDLGFDKDQILVLNETQLLGTEIDAFKNDLQASPMVKSVTVSRFIPTSGANSNLPYLRADAPSNETVTLQNWSVDYDYAKTFDLEIIDGRFFSPEFGNETSNIVINQTALERLQIKEDPVGKQIKKTIGGEEIYTIVGVVKDFHLSSPTRSIQPQIFFLDKSTDAVSIKFETSETVALLDAVTTIWQRFSDGRPLDYYFLDARFEASFDQQQKEKSVFTSFAILAITIACLGLLGLAAFATEQRKKEIGIRKVLGASTYQVLSLLFANFTRPILIASLLAIPVGFLAMQDWLSAFAYRINLGPQLFIVAVVSTVAIAWITVVFQSLKAAKRNPVDNLRYE